MWSSENSYRSSWTRVPKEKEDKPTMRVATPIRTAVIMATFILTSQLMAVTQQKQEVQVPGSLAKFNMIKLPDGKVEKDGKATEIKNLWIGETEISWDVYSIWAFKLDLSQADQAAGVEKTTRPSKPYGAPDRGFGFKGFPAIGMHSNAAIKFTEWLSAKTGKKFRLATEAEWEYAAAAGQPLPSDIGSVAWFWDNTEEATMPIGKKKPNAWGLYDVLGNAAEWTLSADGTPVVKGGSFVDKKPLINFTGKFPLVPKWQEADAHTPKSIWWLSDAPHVGLRIVMEG